MLEYHKIQSLYKRDPSGKHMLFGQYSLPEFEYLRDNQWQFTEKVDGMNIRIIIVDGQVRFGGKTDNAQLPVKLLTRLQERFLLNPLLTEKIPNGVLYGEGYGAGIQKGGAYRPDQDFVLFDVFIGNGSRGSNWLSRQDVIGIAINLGVDVVPVIGHGTLGDLEKTVPGLYSRWGQFHAEGIVARPMVELKTRYGDRLIVKLKQRDFLNAIPDFCLHCGARVPPIAGEGTCEKCDLAGVQSLTVAGGFGSHEDI